MTLKEVAAIFLIIFSFHFLPPVNVCIGAGPMEHIKAPVLTPAQNTFYNYGDNDARKEDWNWEEMFFRAVKINERLTHFIVSSELEPVDPFMGLGRYGGHRLFDDDTITAWVEGVEGQGQGEFIIFRAGEDFPEKVIIHSGYQKSERLFKMNSRPHTLNISLYAGFYLEGDDTEISSRYRLRPLTGTEVLELDDIMGAQTFFTPFNEDKVMMAKDTLKKLFVDDYWQEIENLKELCPTCDPEPSFSIFIKLEINDVYKGSEWADNCISEISYISSSNKANRSQTGVTAEAAGIVRDSSRVAGEPAGVTIEPTGVAGDSNRKAGQSGPLEGNILKVYEDDDPDAGLIYVDTDSSKGIILVDKSELEENEIRGGDESLNIVLMDVSPDREWAQVDVLFYLSGAGRVEEYSVLYNVRMLQRVNESILGTKYGIFGFVEDNGKIWLDTIDGFIDLDIIRDKMLKARDKSQVLR